MKPRTPFIQTFERLPDEIPIYTLGNALLPGGELPLELSSKIDFLHSVIPIGMTRFNHILIFNMAKPGNHQ